METSLQENIANGRTWLAMATGDTAQKAAAAGILGDSLRRESVELGIMRRAFKLEKESIGNQSQQLDSVMPAYIREARPGSIGAVVQPTGGSVPNVLMGLQRYMVKCARNAATDISGDVDALAGYNDDAMKLYQEWQIRDLLFNEDSKGLNVMFGCTGDLNTVWDADNYRYSMTGAKGCVGLGATLNRTALTHLEKGLLSTNAVLEAATYICNVLTFRDFLTFDRTEAGGNWAEDMLTKGIGQCTDPLGKKWVTTNKTGLVADGHILALAAQEYLGNFIEVKETAVQVKHEKWWITGSAWNMTGFALGNAAAVARGVVGQTLEAWK